MFYNVYQQDYFNLRSIILAVEEKNVAKVVNAYLEGKTEVTIKGKKYTICDYEFAIYRVNPDLGSLREQVEAYLKKYTDAYHSGFMNRNVFRETGVDVTDDFLQDREFGSLKEEERPKQSIRNDIWTSIHPSIRLLAEPRFESKHFADGVEAAFKEVNDIIKKAYKLKTGQEEDGDALMRKAFSVNNPVFKFSPNVSQSDKSIQQGYMDMFAGAMKGIRNPKAHANLNVHPDEAWEMIVIASHFMRMWDKTKDYE
jgi:uncharacterized protein (TIGR02391 family)